MTPSCAGPHPHEHIQTQRHAYDSASTTAAATYAADVRAAAVPETPATGRDPLLRLLLLHTPLARRSAAAQRRGAAPQQQREQQAAAVAASQMTG